MSTELGGMNGPFADGAPVDARDGGSFVRFSLVDREAAELAAWM